MDLSGLVILVTGASKGIGRALTKTLYNYGATVIGVYNKTNINEIYDTYRCDISKEEEIKELFNYINKKYNKLDVLVNSAAISMDNDIYDKSKKEFMKVLEVNLVGTFLMCKYASLLMNKGVIVNISSTNATDTYNILSMDYDASKAGVTNLSKNLANRFPSIKVVTLEPNWVNTESVLEMDKEYLMKELKRVGQKKLLTKEEVVNKIIEIIIKDEIVSGIVIRMDGSNE